jgi:hypothetical protein
MKKLSYLMASVVGAAVIVIGCNQVAPTTPSENKVVQEQADEAVLPQSAGAGTCCPSVFVLAPAWGSSSDRNGDGLICQKATPQGTVTIDNRVPGDCYVWIAGECCPYGFELIWRYCSWELEDENGDGKVCRKTIDGNVIIYDNDASGDCYLYCPVPPCGMCAAGI